mmetsp:Transcript_22484/g.55712  ORF Transcript_22484/g.55712 Transcript_22484/m.55712 type:complete len:262 (+) Transcript_22484:264-1049(+)
MRKHHLCHFYHPTRGGCHLNQLREAHVATQLCADDARVQGGRLELRLVPLLELLGEENISQLALLVGFDGLVSGGVVHGECFVIVEIETRAGAPQVSARAEPHLALGFFHKKFSEEEVPDDVDAHLRLEAVFGDTGRGRHDARIEDENVDGFVLPIDIRRELLDGCKVREVDQGASIHGVRPKLFRHLGHKRILQLGVPSRDNHIGAFHQQHPGGLRAEPRVSAGNEKCFTSDVAAAGFCDGLRRALDARGLVGGGGGHGL